MEIWKDIPGYGNHYQASSLGNIRSKDRIVTKFSILCGRVVQQRYKGRLLNPTESSKWGHLFVHLGIDGKKYNLHVARLVLLAFVGECQKGQEACHNDGNARNNSVENLRWDTHAANNADRKNHGRYAANENHPMAKFTDRQIDEIYRSKEPGVVLAKRYGVSTTHISGIRRGQRRKTITQKDAA